MLFTLGSLLLVAAPAAGWAQIGDETDVAWASRRDLTSSQFAESFREYRARGYMMVDVDAYPQGNELRYAMVWRDNTDGRGWAEHRDMSSDGYGARWREYRGRGYRPLDIEAYLSGNNLRFAGIWVENKEGLRWTSRRGMTGEQYADHFRDQRAAGLRLVDVEAYETPAGLRYAAIWYENRDNVGWAQLRNMTRERYQREVEERGAAGFWVTDFESYRTSGGQRYAAIWEKRPPGRAYQVRTNRTELQFANLWRQYRDEGYRLVDFERYQTPQGPRYAGIWIENDSRFDYARKGQLDAAIEAYRANDTVPGISVAVVRDGELLYRRGFGRADVAGGKIAHGETVYLAASVSKVIGGTLAAKLEDEDRLRDGTPVDLDLTRRTSAYLRDIRITVPGFQVEASLPAHHTHQVDHLLAHLGCVAHYPRAGQPPSGTVPGIRNQTRHYSSATLAAMAIWDTSLVTTPSCEVGEDRVYSTHAFTLVGAVLERATGRSIVRLLEEELAQPYALGSMRAQWARPSLPADYDRAVPYSSRNNPVDYADNSWKVLGGGIEIHPMDLARFGWLVLNGDVVEPGARDNRMWSPVHPDCGAPGGGRCRNGLAWELRTIGGRRVAEHGGTATGARAHLRIYRDDGLVVALMSNRRGHPIGTLATTLGNIVLAP